MSKSLGTGIDPLEMIDKYGADATRFGLLLMSSSQDVRFSEEKIAMGRSFANKLWNAARLVLLAAEGVPARRAATTRSTAGSPAGWRAPRAAVSEAARRPAISRPPSTALYHFVWDEFCDWYLEMVKVRLYSEDAAVRRAAAGHALLVLDGSCACCTRSCRS